MAARLKSLLVYMREPALELMAADCRYYLDSGANVDEELLQKALSLIEAEKAARQELEAQETAVSRGEL